MNIMINRLKPAAIPDIDQRPPVGESGLKAAVTPSADGPDDVFTDDISFPATDGYLLGASLYLPRGVRRNAVLINSATAVPHKIYRGFARYLASRGCTVLTYDYRGIGDSRPKSATGSHPPRNISGITPRNLPNKPPDHPAKTRTRSLVGFEASMSEWAARDVTAAVAWMRERYPKLPLAYVGHSFGGQALGLLPNNTEVSRALLIAAQAGYWGLMRAPERYRAYFLLNFVGAPLTRLIGYAPRWSGIGTDLPKEVFLQWVRWVNSKRYLFDDRELKALANFANYRGALRSLCLSDDPWATRPAIELMCSGFSSITPEIATITPADAGVARIGHLGFFQPELRNTLWRTAADWLQGDT